MQETLPRLSDVESSVVLRSVFAITSALTDCFSGLVPLLHMSRYVTARDSVLPGVLTIPAVFLIVSSVILLLGSLMRYPGSLPHFVYKCSHGNEYLRRLLERALLFVLFASYFSTIEVACYRNGKPGVVERGRIQGVLGVHGPPSLGLHRNIEQYVYYPAIVHLSAFTVRSIILFINAAILRINSIGSNFFQIASGIIRSST